MLSRIQLQLYSLPSQIAQWLQTWYGGRFVWSCGLEGMHRPNGLIDKRQAMAARLVEEFVKVAAD